MRKIESIDYTDVDTQKCLQGINDELVKLKIAEKDVISIQKIWNDNPGKIYPPRGKEDKGNVTLLIFYWAN